MSYKNLILSSRLQLLIQDKLFDFKRKTFIFIFSLLKTKKQKMSSATEAC